RPGSRRRAGPPNSGKDFVPETPQGFAGSTRGGLAMRLEVPFYAQRVGLLNGPSVDDPDGCWYVSVKMIGTYHEGTAFRTRKGVPELTNADGTHQAIGRLPDGRDGYALLLKNENLEALLSPQSFTLDYLTGVVKDRGPILFFWWSTNYATGMGFYHASVI